jgi:hypothetical protein
MLLLADAIRSLRPESEFSYIDNDYATIKWDVLKGDAPSKDEVLAELARLEAEAKAKLEARSASKAALLERLGITADEAALLLA